MHSSSSTRDYPVQTADSALPITLLYYFGELVTQLSVVVLILFSVAVLIAELLIVYLKLSGTFNAICTHLLMPA